MTGAITICLRRVAGQSAGASFYGRKRFPSVILKFPRVIAGWLGASALGATRSTWADGSVFHFLDGFDFSGLEDDADAFVAAHRFGGLGFLGFGSFFNSDAAFSKAKSTRRGCASTNAR